MMMSIPPIRTEDNPLPNNFPRTINNERAIMLLKNILDNGFTNDEIKLELKSRVRELTGAKYVVSLSNCTSACHTALNALKINPGDEVICSPISDYANVFGILACNGVPIFADVDKENGLINAETINNCINRKTKAILAVHFWGIVSDMDGIAQVASDYSLPVIEDCCQAPFANYKGRISGNLGDIGLYTFDSEKHWSAGGGGLLMTNNEKIADRAEKFGINRGATNISGYGRINDMLGFNYKPNPFSEAVALAQMDTLFHQLDERRAVLSQLNRKLNKIEGLHLPISPPGSENLAWIFHFRLDPSIYHDISKIAKTMEYLGLKGIGPAYYYYLPESCREILMGSELYKMKNDNMKINCPDAIEYINNTLRWFFTEKYSCEDIDDIADIIRKALELHYNSS